MSADRLVEKPVEEVLLRWRPGSRDWGWAEEFYHLLNDPQQKETTAAVRLRVIEEGVGFIDGISPILLGSDGRVWDGHHRLCVARELGIETVWVDVA